MVRWLLKVVQQPMKRATVAQGPFTACFIVSQTPVSRSLKHLPSSCLCRLQPPALAAVRHLKRADHYLPRRTVQADPLAKRFPPSNFWDCAAAEQLNHSDLAKRSISSSVALSFPGYGGGAHCASRAHHELRRYDQGKQQEHTWRAAGVSRKRPRKRRVSKRSEQRQPPAE